MSIYQNIYTGELVLAQQWDGSKKLFDELVGNAEGKYFRNYKHITRTIPDWDSFNVIDRNHYLEYHKGMNLYLLSYSATTFDDDIKQAVHIGDYLVRNNKHAKVCFHCIRKKDFEENYKKYKLVQPTLKHMYFIIRLCGEYSDATNTFVLATGSHKQGKILTKFLNTLYIEDNNAFVLFKFPNNSNINLKTIRWC